MAETIPSDPAGARPWQGWPAEAWGLIRPYFASSHKAGALSLAAVIVVLNLANVYLQVALNRWNASFYNALQAYDRAAFIDAIVLFAVLAALFILVAGSMIYLQMLLKIRWRQWLTDWFVGRWLDDQAHYRFDLAAGDADNPDQRISEDIRLFIDHTLDLSLGLLVAATTLVSFVVILWNLSGTLELTIAGVGLVIPGYLVGLAVVYALAGTGITAAIGRPLVQVEFLQQRFEADFRFTMMRLREHGESIAFYRGEEREKKAFSQRFALLIENYLQMMRLDMLIAFFQAGYNVSSLVFAIVAAAPRYFSRKILIGELMQVANAYSQVHGSLSYIINSYTRIAEWRAVTRRLADLAAHLEVARKLGPGPQPQTCPGPPLHVAGLTVRLPDARVLLKDLELELGPCQRILITGPSGCGKSTLLRCLAGIWPFGEGTVCRPEDARVLFVPQKSYFPLDSLRAAVAYPATNGKGNQDRVIAKALADCGLAHLGNRLDEVADWARVLSGGEQQRLAFARVLVQAPDVVFLDEASASLDEDNETRLYTLLDRDLPAAVVVSVGHRSSLRRFHQSELRFLPQGAWELVRITG